MGKRNVPDEGWTEEGEKWFNSLPVEDVVDLNMISKYGVDSEEDQQKLDELRASYEQATGETWD